MLVLITSAMGCAHHHERLHLSPWTRPASRPSTSQSASRPPVRVTPMTIQVLPPQTYFYESATVTALNVQQAIERLTADLTQAADDGTVKFVKPCTFVFQGRSAELQKPFTLDVGFPVAIGTHATGRFKVRQLPPFRCAAVMFTGPGSLIDKAYDELDPSVDSARLKRTDESREVYVNWEGPDSPNDQVLVGIGVK